GAEQSTVYVGLAGPPRYTPEYHALQVMNTILGGMFGSRLNLNLRERKGITYGAGSGFAYGRGPGAFRAGADIVTEQTHTGLVEIMREIRGVRGEIPLTDEEVATAKASLIQSLPSVFE
ncbi:MAG TPA: insulinase family protein, partial [Armatimonadota bacterium]|nr:insulinase family protein [Armatimonadota bacterium]